MAFGFDRLRLELIMAQNGLRRFQCLRLPGHWGWLPHLRGWLGWGGSHFWLLFLRLGLDLGLGLGGDRLPRFRHYGLLLALWSGLGGLLTLLGGNIGWLLLWWLLDGLKLKIN